LQPKSQKENAWSRASRGTRTPDLLITNQQLYQLSYAGSKKRKISSFADSFEERSVSQAWSAF